MEACFATSGSSTARDEEVHSVHRGKKETAASRRKPPSRLSCLCGVALVLRHHHVVNVEAGEGIRVVAFEAELELHTEAVRHRGEGDGLASP